MSTNIVVPELGESITEATIAQWLKKEGDAVTQDEPLVELETDKVTLEVNAPAAGTLGKITAQEDDTVEVGAVIGLISAGAAATASKDNAEAPKIQAVPTPSPAPAPTPTPATMPQPAVTVATPFSGGPITSPAASKILSEGNGNPAAVAGTGKDGRITKHDAVQFIAQGGAAVQAVPSTQSGPREERVKMTRLRQRIAERLKEAQNTAAILTTFNEIDMTHVMALRKKYKEKFEKKHDARLGFMSFFTKAAVTALKEFPAVNAEIDGKDLVYKNHYDIGMAVSTPQGLVVPVVRDTDKRSFAEIEQEIARLGKKGRDGKLSMDELTGGTFTITNGGVFGSLVSTPILNPPQSAILGLHAIQERPVALNGEVVIRPMMYTALSYDHRIIDGREAVGFLVRIKECMEDPQRLLLDM